MALNAAQKRNIALRYLQAVYDDSGKVGDLAIEDIEAAIEGLETYVGDNVAAINTAIPQPAKASLDTNEKALLLAGVAMGIAGQRV